MSGSIAALFQRLTQGVYVVGVAHGEVRNAVPPPTSVIQDKARMAGGRHYVRQ